MCSLGPAGSRDLSRREDALARSEGMVGGAELWLAVLRDGVECNGASGAALGPAEDDDF